jgi:hypothetical protein
MQKEAINCHLGVGTMQQDTSQGSTVACSEIQSWELTSSKPEEYNKTTQRNIEDIYWGYLSG